MCGGEDRPPNDDESISERIADEEFGRVVEALGSSAGPTVRDVVARMEKLTYFERHMVANQMEWALGALIMSLVRVGAASVKRVRGGDPLASASLEAAALWSIRAFAGGWDSVLPNDCEAKRFIGDVREAAASLAEAAMAEGFDA